MSGAPPAGVCKDMPMKDGRRLEGHGRRLEGHGGKEPDLCKLSTDGPKACADMLASGLEAVKAEEKCALVASQIKFDSEEETKCVADMTAAVPPPTTTTVAPPPAPAPAATDATDDAHKRQAPGAAVLAFAAAVLSGYLLKKN